MKKSDLKPGTKVLCSLPNNDWESQYVKYYYDSYDETTLVGTVLNKPAKTGKVWISMEKSDHNSEGDEVEIRIDILTLEAERPKIEKEFKSFSVQIKEKMKEAAKLVLEANKLANKAHAASLADMYDAVGPLVNAMDNSGWNSSSWGC